MNVPRDRNYSICRNKSVTIKHAQVVCISTFFTAVTCLNVSAQEIDFSPPEEILPGSSENYFMPRNPSKSLVADSNGQAHFTYWGGMDGFTVNDQTFVQYLKFTSTSGWEAPITVNETALVTTSSGTVSFEGARHPSLALDEAESPWVVWHDRRHCNMEAPGNGVDNYEIYVKPMDGSGGFSGSDIRITETATGNLFDNGYQAKAAIEPNGRISILWYDFHFEAEISDLFFLRSSLSKVFPDPTDMSSYRITNYNDRGGMSAPAYSNIDLTSPEADTYVATWTEGFLPPSPLYVSVFSETTSTLSPTVVDAQTECGGEPARTTVGPDGSTWIVYTRRVGAERDVYAARVRPGNTSADSPIQLAATPSVRESSPDIEVDSDNNLHVVWNDQRSGQHIYYGYFSGETGELIAEKRITETSSTWTKPAITVLQDGEILIVFEEIIIATSTHKLWYAEGSLQLPMSAEAWRMYP